MPNDGVRSDEVVSERIHFTARRETIKRQFANARNSDPMSPMISDPRIAYRVAMKHRTSFVHSHRTPIEHLSIQRSKAPWACVACVISTKAIPRGWPVSLFSTIVTVSTAPCTTKTSRSCCSVTVISRLAIKMLVTSHSAIDAPEHLRNEKHTSRSSKGTLHKYRLFAWSRALRVAARFQLASPWGPSSHRRCDPPEGF